MRLPVLLRAPLLSASVLVLVYAIWQLGAPLTEAVGIFILITVTATTLAVLVILVQGAQEDFSLAGEDASELILPRDDAMRLTGQALIFSLLLAFWFSYALNGNPLQWLTVLTPDYYGRASPGSVISDWLANIVVAFLGAILFHIALVSRRQVQLFRDWAEKTPIDLLDLDRFQWLVWQPLRYALITAIQVSLNVITVQFLKIDGDDSFLYNTLLPMLALTLLLGLHHLSPLFVIRTRVAEVKQREIALVRRAVRGERDALAESQIAHIAGEFSAPDLLAYETRIQGCREWPIEGAVQRILFYVLLPPVAWVLAALVERMLDVVL